MRLHQEPGFGGHLVVGQKRSFGTGVKEYCDGRFSVRMDFRLYLALTESIMVRFALDYLVERFQIWVETNLIWG